MANFNSNLLVCCNFLTRIETLLELGTRIQISKDSLNSVSEYLTKAIKYIDPSIDVFGNQLIIFGKCIEALDSLTSENEFVATNYDTKKFLIDKLSPTIREFKVNVGKYLSDRDFDYSPAMDSVIKDIIELCLDDGYYFGY